MRLGPPWACPSRDGRGAGCDGYGFDLVFGPNTDAPATHIATRYNGLYMVYNIAAAFFAAREMGVDAAHLQPTLNAYVPAGGRMGRWILPAAPSRPIWPRIPWASIAKSSPLKRQVAGSAPSS